ncbi:hypothetical protein QUC31_001497 [Theobroma cacao]
MLLQTTISSPPLHHHHVCFSATLPHSYSFLSSGSLRFSRKKLSFQAIVQCYCEPALKNSGTGNGVNDTRLLNPQIAIYKLGSQPMDSCAGMSKADVSKGTGNLYGMQRKMQLTYENTYAKRSESLACHSSGVWLH